MSTSIVVYTSPQCGYCNKQKEWLAEQGVKYIERSTTDSENRKELVRLNAIGVPFTIFSTNKEETYVTGFNKKKLESLIKEHVS
ncbi:glutaredoxin family protein [Priestia megaterium]|uniref:glutaredoxin family protein n=1 Tax=Priestia megaterium TaxID=1404 RepID=UPI002FFED444